jgi:hypothetical protein
MKKIYPVTKRLSITSLLFVFFYAAHAQLPFADGFESGNFITGGWGVTGAAQISTQFPAQGIYCVEGPATWGLTQTYSSFPVTDFIIEFDARASQTNTICLIFRIKDSGTGTSAGLFFNDLGSIIGVDGNGSTSSVTIANYDPNKWYSIRFIIDMTTHTYDIYIDHVLAADDFQFFSGGFTYPYLFSWSSVATSGTAWLDNVNIYAFITSLTETDDDVVVHLYPNPAYSHLQLTTANTSGFMFTLYDTAGSVLLEKEIQTLSSEIDLTGLKQGMYFGELRNSDNRILFHKKIIKL